MAQYRPESIAARDGFTARVDRLASLPVTLIVLAE
jgi:hypothetical protein